MGVRIQEIGKKYKIDKIFDIYKDTTGVAFLDSSLENKLGRYSIIGLNPYIVIKKVKNIVYQNKNKRKGTFEQNLRNILKKEYQKNNSNLPIISGAIGYFSYEYNNINYNQENVDFTEEIPEAMFSFYDNFIIQDHSSGEVFLSGNGKLKDSDSSILDIIEEIKRKYNHQEYQLEEHLEYQVKIKANFEPNDYKKAVKKVIDYIIAGDIYIANMTQKLLLESAKMPYNMYQKLRKTNPAPFGAYLNQEDFQIISASPERFLRVKNNLIDTRPIKGTRKRGQTLEEDKMLKNELKNSKKDQSELLMIVDLERNDLSKICKKNSVKVEELYSIEEYATVFHLVANIQGQLEEGYDTIDIIEAMFPGGSITGAPKKRAMEIIQELEQGNRGLYTGALGYLSLDGNCDFNIVIRTVVHQKGKYFLGVGGGITCESELDFEFEETLQKAKAIIEALR
jgi:aminodeoxychorismate synthase, component I, bacterial clade